MEVLPTYFNLCKALDMNTGKKPRSVTSKRNYWLRKDKNESTEFKKSKSIKTGQKTVRSEDNTKPENLKEYSTTKMPLLSNKPYTAPVFEISNKNEQHGYTLAEQNDDNWTLSNQKENKKELKTTSEFNSHVYLPKYVPITTPSKELKQEASIIFPLSIKLLPNKDCCSKICHSQIVYAVLCAMQKVHADTYLGPIKEDPTTKLIYDIKNIPLERTNIKEYLAIPVNPKQNAFLGKVYIYTNHYLQEYQSSELFTNYLRKENIIIEINSLDNVNPVQLGFI
jgi:hypothetical protein